MDGIVKDGILGFWVEHGDLSFADELMALWDGLGDVIVGRRWLVGGGGHGVSCKSVDNRLLIGTTMMAFTMIIRCCAQASTTLARWNAADGQGG